MTTSTKKKSRPKGQPVTLFTGQWADLPLKRVAAIAKKAGYDGLELACWGDHFDVVKASDPKTGPKYCAGRRALLAKYGLKVWAISTHLFGQNVGDCIYGPSTQFASKVLQKKYAEWCKSPIGIRTLAQDSTAVPVEIAEEIRAEAIDLMMKTAQAAKNLGVEVVNGFVGSPIWKHIYSFPPVSKEIIDGGFEDIAKRWIPILDEFKKYGIKFALEVHPTEIAFDVLTSERLLEALDHHPAFGFNYDPSHFPAQNVDYVEFIHRFGHRIFHVHVKDAGVEKAGPGGTFGSHLDFGTPLRGWDFCSPGRGCVDFEKVYRALQDVGYTGSLSVEWEDARMDRIHGATEACQFVRQLQFPKSNRKFDKAFSEKKVA